MRCLGLFYGKTEWKLNAHMFQHIVRTLETPNIDLCASKLNHQLKPDVSWMPDEKYVISMHLRLIEDIIYFMHSLHSAF